jgi:hypothetical protein
MSDVAAPLPSSWDRARAAGAVRRYRTPLALVAVLALLVAGVAAGNAWGRHQAGTRTLTGRAYSTPYQIGVTVDGWTYGIPVSVPWYDATGAFHEDGRPGCLPASAQLLPVTFGAVTVTHDGASWREVVWVSCRGR